jgi:hypothetical protein
MSFFSVNNSDSETLHLNKASILSRKIAFKTKRKYKTSDYEKLITDNRLDRRNITWHEAAAVKIDTKESIFTVRHDIDHDLETALKIAHWEYRNGIRATYCILHTAWYYGVFENGSYRHYDFLVNSCKQLLDLGHEINFHNNLIPLAFETDADPYEVLEREIAFFRSNKIPIWGTSTHGHKICRELNFRNFELFSESVYASRGGPRTIEYNNRSVTIGVRSMKEFGLEYECYDLPRDIYHTDSGGNLRTVLNTRGRGGYRRDKLEITFPYESILAILTHPIWWDFNAS